MSKLTDTQTMLLAHASHRKDGNLYPLPEALAGTDRAKKAIAILLRRALAEKRESDGTIPASRTDGDRRHGIFISVAGLAAIGITDADEAKNNDSDAERMGPIAEASTSAPAAARTTKARTVLLLLQRDTGATLDEIVEATGWLPHTTRAALTGLRKQGHSINRYKRGEATCYRLTAVLP